ncbi:MAG TPA: pantoate--beta-alanine ligase [Longimicrobiales bacterium]|nr:pantoate--beta-alanine ligase [Longimicrobiales bacterium]
MRSEDLRALLDEARARGSTIALVPTMGSLHDGHLSLVDRAAELSDLVVLSIFVNPLQFGPGEDLDRYPRDLDRDVRLAGERGVDVVFAPSIEAMYPDGAPSVTVAPGALADRLCGAARPGHFEGVLTVVAKLLHIARPDVAVFGRKDYQQGVLVRRMVFDLSIPVRVELAPLVREPDGLALSSRNALLSSGDRGSALSLSRGLFAARDAFRAGQRDGPALEELVRREIEAAPALRLQYAELVRPDTLERAASARARDVLAVAAFAGDTRLIDNVEL